MENSYSSRPLHYPWPDRVLSFCFQRLMVEKVARKSAPSKCTWKKFEENIKKNIQPEVLPEFQDSIVGESPNHSDLEVNY